MPAYKDKAKGTWYASFYYEDWTGTRCFLESNRRSYPNCLVWQAGHWQNGYPGIDYWQLLW